ncbi:MAG TPA: sphingomyelin phosphodiesterase [Myxococcales bacterium]|jgi:endonuclease/exonuclease/phosphatase family metal-dependent hydrolase
MLPLVASLSILTWNVFMMPRWVHESPGNAERARAIVEVLRPLDHDILVLEKVFDGGARDILRNGLKDKYPYSYGPVNGSGFSLKLNGGVVVLSRIPLTGYREIQFDDAIDVEVFSRKGAMLLSGVKDGQPFQLVATHLQGDEDDAARSREVRKLQIDQIESQLVAAHADPHVPLFVAGDFCLPRWDGAPDSPESAAYRLMLEVLMVRNGPERRITLNDTKCPASELGSTCNDLASDGTGRLAELDYILVRPNGHAVEGHWQRHVFQAPWSVDPFRHDLSYRYAVSARFDWK